MNLKEILPLIRKYKVWIIVAIVVLAMLYSVVNRLMNGRKPAAGNSPTPAASSSPTQRASSSPNTIPSATTTTPAATSSPDDVTLEGGRFFDLDQATETIYYYDELSGNLKRYSLTGKTTTTIGSLTGLVEQIAWSPDHTRLIVMYKAGGEELSLAEQSNLGREIALIEIAPNKITPLNKNIVSFDFITNGKIIYHYKDAQFSNLSVADVNGDNWKNIGHVNDTILFKRLGDTVLTQPIASSTVTVYDSTGKKITDYKVPEGFYLDQSSWSNQSTSLYWVSDPSAISINRYAPGKPNQLIGLTPPQAEPAILWDNIKGDIYMASFSGLVKLDVKAGAQ